MRDSFILYTEYNEQLKALSNEQFGILMRAIFTYQQTGEILELEPAVQIAFSFIKLDLDKNNQKWEEEKQKRVEAGKIGGITRAMNNGQALSSKSKECLDKLSKSKECLEVLSDAKQNQAELSNPKQSQANQADNVYVYVNDNVLNNSSTTTPTPPPEKQPNKKNESNWVDFWNNNIGLITPYQAEMIQQYIADGLEEELVILAMQEAIDNGKKNLRYISAILNNCLNSNVLTAAQFKARQLEYKTNKEKEKRKTAKPTYERHYNAEPLNYNAITQNSLQDVANYKNTENFEGVDTG